MILTKRDGLLRCALALGLVILLSASVSAGGGILGFSTKKADKGEDDFFLRMRPRMGHFVSNVDDEKYLKIYEREYFVNVIQRTDPSMVNLPVDDWRNVRPTGEICVNFLQGFQVRSYAIGKPYDVIILDACLGWLFEEKDEFDADYERFNDQTKKESDKLLKDTKFKSIYDSTDYKDDKIPKELKEKLYEYYTRLLKVHAQYPDKGCHSLWLEAFNDFIEDIYLGDCDSDEDCMYFGYEGAKDDSYLKLIVDSTIDISKSCYNVIAKQIPNHMLSAYKDSVSALRKIRLPSNKVAKQSSSMKWSRELIRILQLVSGLDSEIPISLSQVVRDLNKLKNNDPETVEKFTEALGEYAIQNVNMNDAANDIDGRARFGKAMTKLCKQYIDPKTFLSLTGGSTLWEDPSSTKKPFDFYNLIYSLIRLTNHESLYGITKDRFEDDVIKFKWEPLYLATFACQIISTTWGELDYGTNEDAYKVTLRPDAEVLIEDWPITKLTDKYAEADEEPEQESPVPAPVQEPIQQEAPKEVHREAPKEARHSESKMKFRLPKIRFGFSQKAENEPNEQASPAIQQSPPPVAAPSQAYVAPTPAHAAPAPTYVAPKPPAAANIVANQLYRNRPNVLASDTIEQFKRLHDRYFKDEYEVGPPLEVESHQHEVRQEPEREDIWSGPRRARKASSVPLAFNFDEDFVGGNKYDKDSPRRTSQEPSAKSKWANLNFK